MTAPATTPAAGTASTSRTQAALLCAAALLLQAAGTASATSSTAPGEPAAAEDAGGLLAMLHALVKATTNRLSGIVLGHHHHHHHDDDGGLGDDYDDATTASTAASAAAPGRVRYHGYQLVRVRLRSRAQAGQLRALVGAHAHAGARLWRHARRNRTADILMSPAAAPALKDSLDDLGLSYRVLSADVQKIISFQNPPRTTSLRRGGTDRGRAHPFTWKRYHRYNDMVSYMHFLAATYPHLAQVLTIGSSTEGRPLYVLKVSSRPPSNMTAGTASPRRRGPRKKPAVWIDAGSHAREWIGPAVAMYVLMELVERHRVHPQLAEQADWYVMPVLNPDGYEFSHSTDRLWRKSRSSHELVSTGRLFREPCAGVDLNRNWDYNWGDKKGASDDPCDESYAGPRPFSEPETRAVSNFILRRRERFQIFLTLHSYSQMWLIPEDLAFKHLPDHQEMYNKARLAVKALKAVRNTRYQIGTASEILYTTSGCSDHWAKGVAGIKYSYTVELPDRGLYGFMLPASFIVPTGQETFAAFQELAKAVVCR